MFLLGMFIKEINEGNLPKQLGYQSTGMQRHY